NELDRGRRNPRKNSPLARDLGLKDSADRRPRLRACRLKRLKVLLALQKIQTSLHRFGVESFVNPPTIGFQMRKRAGTLLKVVAVLFLLCGSLRVKIEVNRRNSLRANVTREGRVQPAL